jgi:hypothetical protein
MKPGLARRGSRNPRSHRDRNSTPFQRWRGDASGGEWPSFWMFGVYQQN